MNDLTQYYNFEGGRNDFLSIDSVADNEYVSGTNTRLVGAKLVRRSGYSTLGTTGAYIITGLFGTSVSTNNFLIAADTRGYLYKMDYTSGSPDGTWDSIGTGFGTTSTLRWSTCDTLTSAQAQIFILTNFNYQPVSWSGSGNVSNLTADTAAWGTIVNSRSKIVLSYGNRILHLNVVDVDGTRPFRFRWSNLNDPDTYSVGDAKDFDSDGSQGITAAFVYNKICYVATDRSIHSITYTGNSAAPYQTAQYLCNKNRGIVGQDAFTDVEGLVILLSADKRLYLFDGGCYAQLDNKINSLLDLIPDNRLPYVQMRYDSTKKELLIACDTASTGANDTIISGNCESFSINNPVVRWNNPWTIPANVLAVVNKNGKMTPYFGDSAGTGYVYLMNSGTMDNAGTITATVRSKALDMGSNNRKGLNFLDVVLKGQSAGNSLSVNVYADGATTTTSTATISQVSSNTIYGPKPMTSIVGASDSLRYQVEFTNTNEFEINKYGLVGQSGPANL